MEQQERTRWTRRRFLAAAAAVAGVAVGGGGYAAVRLTTPPPPPPRTAPPRTASYRSRPDLTPPVLTVTTRDGGAIRDPLFLTPLALSARSGPLILDGNGDPLWFLPIYGKNRFAADLRVQRLGGDPVLTWWEGIFNGSGGEGEYVVADTSYREIRRFRAGRGVAADLHELLLTPDDTAMLIVYERARADLTSLGGGADHPIFDCVIQEMDIATGALRFEWRARDHIRAEDSYLPLPSDRSVPYDFFHLNSIQRDAAGDMVLSARHTWALYKVNGRSGDVIWTMNGRSSDFAVDSGARFAWQHDARFHPDRLLSLFDNAAMKEAGGKHSRGLLLAVDEARRTVKLVREYAHPRGLLSTSQANMQRLADGGALIGWGSQPYVSEFGTDGRLRFDGHFDAGLQSYRAYRMGWAGRPSDAPAIAADAIAPGTVDVYASWNGATDVATWEVRAGTPGGEMVPVASAPRRGFETRIPCRADGSHVDAVARDARGTVLSTSATVQIA